METPSAKLRQPVLVGEIYLDRLFLQSLRRRRALAFALTSPVRRDFSLSFLTRSTGTAVGSALPASNRRAAGISSGKIFRDAKGTPVPWRADYSISCHYPFQSP